MSRAADRIASGDLDVHVPDQDGELCVLANAFNNMAARLRELIGRLEEKVAGGSFIDRNGRILGTHKGYPFYTIGQRKGLKIAVGEPLHVL